MFETRRICRAELLPNSLAALAACNLILGTRGRLMSGRGQRKLYMRDEIRGCLGVPQAEDRCM